MEVHLQICDGCNSILAQKLQNYLIFTEAGFGADLGAEKFLILNVAKQNPT